MPTLFDYDVFFSYDPADEARLLDLASRLRADGVRVWLDQWEPPDPKRPDRDRAYGLKNSRVLLAAISGTAQGERWDRLEEDIAVFRELSDAERRFLPVRLDPIEVQETIRQFARTDWIERSDSEYEVLSAFCRKREAAESHEAFSEHRFLHGHSKPISRVALTSTGATALSSSGDGTLRIWDLNTNSSMGVLKGHHGVVVGVGVSADGQFAVSGSHDKTVRLWDVATRRCISVLVEDEGGADDQSRTDDESRAVFGLAITPDARMAVAGEADLKIRIWDLDRSRCVGTLDCSEGAQRHDPNRSIRRVAISANGRLVAASVSFGVQLWNVETQTRITTLEGHTGIVNGLAMTKTGDRIASASEDGTVRLWDTDSAKCLSVLGGHQKAVNAVAVTDDGRRAVSASDDMTVRVWDLDRQQCVAISEGHTSAVNDIAITPDGRRVFSGAVDFTARAWDLPLEDSELMRRAGDLKYTNAKVLLVGESGVGKTGLAIRLTQDHFEPTVSSDAVWATQMKLPQYQIAGIYEREIWLWDFAGQADYRLIHQLFLDETALALLVFNPQSENPFEGLCQWDRDLTRAARRPFRKVLVGARCDRGALMVSRHTLDTFMEEYG